MNSWTEELELAKPSPAFTSSVTFGIILKFCAGTISYYSDTLSRWGGAPFPSGNGELVVFRTYTSKAVNKEHFSKNGAVICLAIRQAETDSILATFEPGGTIKVSRHISNSCRSLGKSFLDIVNTLYLELDTLGYVQEEITEHLMIFKRKTT